ncbi:MAG: hypothetical protein M1469_00535 [Bacteroidetes bacterium]|nr:hypothetical protein [Bacteroidota bacterium]
MSGSANTLTREKPLQRWLTGVAAAYLTIAGFVWMLVTTQGNLYNNVIVGIILMIGGFGAVGPKKQTIVSVN